MDVKYHLRGCPVGTGTLKNLSINLKSSRSTTGRSSKRRHSTAHALSTPILDTIQERHGRLLISDPVGTLQNQGSTLQEDEKPEIHGKNVYTYNF